jgi:hypothetical protein
LSVQEAAYHGVPIVGVPLTLGQGELVQRAQDEGRGLVVPKGALMSGEVGRLAAAVLQVAPWNSSFHGKVRGRWGQGDVGRCREGLLVWEGAGAWGGIRRVQRARECGTSTGFPGL